MITSPFSFIATAEVIALAGATRCSSMSTWSLQPRPGRLEAAIGERTRAMMRRSACLARCRHGRDQHNRGAPPDTGRSRTPHRARATYHDRRPRPVADWLHKLFPAAAGMVATAVPVSPMTRHWLVFWRGAAQPRPDRQYHHPRIGINGRMDGMQAAVILAKMEIFDDEVARARASVPSATPSCCRTAFVLTPAIADGYTSVYAQYTLQVDNRDAVRKALQDAGYRARYTTYHLDQQPALAGRLHQRRLPRSRTLAGQSDDSLPMHPYLDETTQDRVVAALRTGL